MLRASILAAVVAAPISSSASPAGSVETSDVEIRTSDSVKLHASFFAPKAKRSDAGNPNPGVLLVHDAGGDRHQLDDLALRLQKSGFAVLALDLRGHGDSSGTEGGWGKLREEEQSRVWALATRDIEAASEWLLSQDEVHSTNLSLVGLGSGCALAVRHAKRDENVRCVVLMAPRSKDFGFDVAADLMKIDGLPTLVLAPRDDDATKAMVAEANGGTHPYVELDYAGARVDSVLEDRKLPSRVAGWIKGCVMPKRGRG